MQKKYQSRKNAICVQEYKKIIAKMEVKLVSKKDKMRKKFKEN